MSVAVAMPTPLSKEPAVIPVLLLLTGVTGVLDAVSLLQLGHVFTANMTGNVVFLGLALGGAPSPSGQRSAAALLAFFVGAAIAGRLALAMASRSQASWLRAALVTEGCLLFLAAAIAASAPAALPGTAGYAIIATTALAMGLRNATLVKLGISDLTTTVVTRTIAGIGADLAGTSVERSHVQPRVLSVALTLLGAAAGFLLVSYSVVLALALCASLIFATVPMLARVATVTEPQV